MFVCSGDSGTFEKDLRDAEIDAFSWSVAEHRAASLLTSALEDLVKVLRTGDDTRLTSLASSSLLVWI
jgi:hypothetical protein